MIDATKIARVCHEANRAFSIFVGDAMPSPPWDNAPEEMRKGATNGVAFLLANPGTTPREQHDEWLRYKTEGGWTWGPDKAPDLKQHPCMVPYDELPAAQRAKDALFQAVVRACLEACP